MSLPSKIDQLYSMKVILEVSKYSVVHRDKIDYLLSISHTSSPPHDDIIQKPALWTAANWKYFYKNFPTEDENESETISTNTD